MAYLITGRAGSGKSTVCLELKRRGYEAYDTDKVSGLANWINLKTDRITEVDYTKYVDYQRIGWNWSEPVVQAFLRVHPAAFLCGSASNQLLFHSHFDRVFVLDVDDSTHRERLRTRSSSYAKDPRQIREILDEQRTLVKQSVKLGAIQINTAQSVPKVVNKILSLIP